MIVGLLAFVFVSGMPLGARAQADAAAQTEVVERDRLRLAHETEEQLLVLGCEKVLITNKQALASARSLGWYAVIPVDATGEAVTMCSPSIVQQLKPLQEGEVSSFLTLNQQMWLLGKVGGFALSQANEATVGALSVLFEEVYKLGKKLFDWLAMGIVPMLQVWDFTGSYSVQKAWPVMLGIANLGFLLALIIIALLVTLRSDAGGGVRKLLPRLLLGAVLINFSLIIGGVIIDVSRLLMAMIANMFDMTTLNEGLFASIYDGSGVISLSAIMNSYTANSAGWSLVGGWFLQAIVVWIMSIALTVILFSLAIRYFALLILLIISPFAYVALAFPGAQKVAMAWWSNFLRYVAYGPIVLIILLITMKSTEFLTLDFFGSVDDNSTMALQVLKAVVFSAGLIFAAVAGRYAGIVGSTMALNIVSRGGKRARSMVYRGGMRAGGATIKGGAKAAYVGTGTRRGLRETRDYIGERFKPARKALGIGEYSPYDKKGKKKPGRTSAGQERGILARSASAKAARAAAVGPPAAIAGHPDLSPAKLSSSDVAKTLRREDIKNIMDNGTQEQKQRLVVQVDVVRKMDDATISNALADADLRSSVEAALRQINRQDNA